jgi:hypothetical protein
MFLKAHLHNIVEEGKIVLLSAIIVVAFWMLLVADLWI